MTFARFHKTPLLAPRFSIILKAKSFCIKA